MYTPPPFETAERLLKSIKEFLQSCGGHYATRWNSADEETHILLSIATGQFAYKKDSYFVCWFMVSDDGIEDLKNHIRPCDVANGNRMWVLECGIKKDLPRLRRQMRLRGKSGVYWHRAGKGLKDFPRQKGANNG